MSILAHTSTLTHARRIALRNKSASFEISNNFWNLSWLRLEETLRHWDVILIGCSP